MFAVCFCFPEKCRALVLEFTLPKAAYATMAIRELMKGVTVVQWEEWGMEQSDKSCRF